ncbi:hypothetical protein CPI04_07985, partial [Moraxella catarrhalis]|nr:hypothetical protein [Moraxella catarrhalis]
AAIRTCETKNLALLKQHVGFYEEKLLGHQDHLSSSRNRSKEKYDSACASLESARQKQDSV